VVEVWSRQLDVAQGDGLERAVVHRRAALRERNATLAERATAEILRGRTHADIVEALVPTIFVDQAEQVGEAARCISQLRSGMALDAPPLAPEDAEPFLLLGRERLRTGQAPVQRRLVRDKSRFVGLDRLTPDPRELGLWVQGRAEGRRDEFTV